MPFIFVGPEFRLSARKYSRHFRPGFREAEGTLTTAIKDLSSAIEMVTSAVPKSSS
jgi:hypothetical protein